MIDFQVPGACRGPCQGTYCRRQEADNRKQSTDNEKQERTESMAMKIRLTRMGSKKKPFYRVVAMNSESRRDGRALDYLGYYNPMKKPAEIKIDMDKVQEWMAKGAKPTDMVKSLLIKAEASSQAV